MPEDEKRLAGVRARIESIIDPVPTPAQSALVMRLLRSFATNTPAAVDALLDSLDDPGELRERAHTLRGSADNIGAGELAAACAALEEQARAGTIADPAGSAGRIRAEADEALRAVLALADELARR
ncbi:Hpt domain-containing protein [Actinoplanes regularis]|uniref:Hpt domain-containing protein n=1 Tax=Actinoplanes regularis TaxID=52697 RepID=A0A239GK46_9ACTN|nr:Hpt domain-containing protein [Actinoplanes regularis]GIE90644.1 hypothetical protein Are01nite_71240 [Actinoplanes regularis]SNS69138.1 Hpt domain-containing protein [Actinoplanes regularis]